MNTNRTRVLDDMKKEIEAKRTRAILERFGKVTIDRFLEIFNQYDDIEQMKFPAEFYAEYHLIEAELGFEKSKLSAKQTREAKRGAMRDFLEYYFKYQKDSAERVEFALNNLSDKSISAIREEMFKKPNDHPKEKLYKFTDKMKTIIAGFIAGENLELEDKLPNEVLREIKKAFVLK